MQEKRQRDHIEPVLTKHRFRNVEMNVWVYYSLPVDVHVVCNGYMCLHRQEFQLGFLWNQVLCQFVELIGEGVTEGVEFRANASSGRMVML
jgi:hypothetical protein